MVSVEVGQVYYNPKRGNCLRVCRIYPVCPSVGDYEEASCMSWRPNGSRGSRPQNIKLESLRTYVLVRGITATLSDGRVIEFPMDVKP